jgi:hypothetical protein
VATRVRRCYSGERRCEGETALGRTVGCGKSTWTTSTRAQNLIGASRGGGDDAQRRMADSGGGGAPAKSNQRLGARTPKPMAPLGSLPRGDATERLQNDRKAATAKLKHGDAARVGGGAGNLGFGDGGGRG